MTELEKLEERRNEAWEKRDASVRKMIEAEKRWEKEGFDPVEWTWLNNAIQMRAEEEKAAADALNRYFFKEASG